MSENVIAMRGCSAEDLLAELGAIAERQDRRWARLNAAMVELSKDLEDHERDARRIKWIESQTVRLLRGEA